MCKSNKKNTNPSFVSIIFSYHWQKKSFCEEKIFSATL